MLVSSSPLYAVEQRGQAPGQLAQYHTSGPVLTVLGELLEVDQDLEWAGRHDTLVIDLLSAVGCIARLYIATGKRRFTHVGYRITSRGRLMFNSMTCASSGPPYRGGA